MKRTLLLLTLIILLCMSVQTAQATGTPQPGDSPQPAATTAATDGGFPWLGALVFVIAGVVYMYVRSLQPASAVITNCCAPLIDEAKMEAERKLIAEEETVMNADLRGKR